MSDQFLGQIQAFAFQFAPKGWAQCNGQLLPIQQNAALFALLGTAFGGNGMTTFALPDLRSRLAVSQGQSPSGSTYAMGEAVGTENVTVLPAEMPMHTHAMNIVNNGTVGGAPAPSSSVQLASAHVASQSEAAVALLYAPAAPAQPVLIENLGPAGGSQPHSNMMPYLTINYCIALQGVFPPRD